MTAAVRPALVASRERRALELRLEELGEVDPLGLLQLVSHAGVAAQRWTSMADFAERGLVRDDRQVRRMLAGESPIAPVVVKRLVTLGIQLGKEALGL